VKVLLLGARGKVGTALAPRLRAAGHEVTEADRTWNGDPGQAEVAVDFTRPDAVRANAERCLAAGIPVVVGTTGLTDDDLAALDALAREQGVACLVVPNFALGAVLMMRYAADASRHLPRAEIVEAHNEAKLDAPSGTAKATAAAMEGEPAIHSIRLPGLVAHQEVLLAGEGQLLTIRHDTFSRDAFAPGVLLALDRLGRLPSGLSRGLEAVIDVV
jgi:4-hydroxy-tetrahydrodipicolinate reductase